MTTRPAAGEPVRALVSRWNDLDPNERDIARFFLARAGCRPADLEPRLAELGVGPALPPPVGTTLVVTSNGKDDAGALFELGRQQGAPSGLPLGPEATHMVHMAGNLAGRDVPIHTELDEPLAWAISILAPRDPTLQPSAIEGASLGLAVALAGASVFLRTPIPSHTVALASLEPDGRTSPVSDLRTKLHTLALFAPGVRRVLVASSQADEAARLARELSVELAVVPLTVTAAPTVAAAIDLALAPDVSVIVAQLTQAERDERADRAFELVISNAPGRLGWRGLSGLAKALAPHYQPGSRRASRLDLVLRVGERLSQGSGAIVLEWPSAELDYEPDEIRHGWIAHVVQSATEGARERARLYADQARALVPDEPRARRADHLKLLGAAGRAYAAVYNYERAAEVLLQAVDGWFGRYLYAESTRALTELTRVAAVVGDGPLLLGTGRSLFQHLHPKARQILARADLPPDGRAFVEGALGRALVLLGHPDEALVYLGRVRSRPMPTGMDHPLRRWSARALEAVGERERAEAERAPLAGHLTQHALSQLDRALQPHQTGAEPTSASGPPGGNVGALRAAVSGFEALRGQVAEAQWLWERVWSDVFGPLPPHGIAPAHQALASLDEASLRAVARRLANEFRH